MKKLLVISYILLILISNIGYTVTKTVSRPSSQDSSIIIPIDKQMHWMVGVCSQSIFESWGYNRDQARLMTLLCAIGYECYQHSRGDNFEDGDIIATVIGSYTFTIIDGINFKLLIK